MITALVLLGTLAASGIAATVVALVRDGHRAAPTIDAGRPGTWAQAMSPTELNASS